MAWFRALLRRSMAWHPTYNKVVGRVGRAPRVELDGELWQFANQRRVLAAMVDTPAQRWAARCASSEQPGSIPSVETVAYGVDEGEFRVQREVADFGWNFGDLQANACRSNGSSQGIERWESRMGQGSGLGQTVIT